MNRTISKAMHQSDDFVVALDYKDSKGKITRRVVSPIRYLAPGRVLAMCLCREEPRQFYLERCSNIRLASSHEFLMPVPMTTV